MGGGEGGSLNILFVLHLYIYKNKCAHSYNSQFEITVMVSPQLQCDAAQAWPLEILVELFVNWQFDIVS